MNENVADELRGLINITEILDHEPTEENSRRRQITIKTSQQEAWYRDVFKTWLDQHPETGISGDNNAGRYRFALTFFVNQINLQMADLKEMTSFIAAMDYLENMQDFGPARQIDELIKTDIRSEIDESSQYAKDYDAYQKRRKNDLANKRQRHRGEGMEFKHD